MAKKKDTKLDPKETEFLLAAIRVKASKIRPYYSTAIFATIPVEKSIGTFAIDKYWRFYYDPLVLREWGIEKAANVLLHEINHPLRNHHKRAELCNATQHLLANVCFPPDTVIPNGKHITDIATQERDFEGTLIKIKTQMGDISATFEHLFWARRRKHKYGLTPVKLKGAEWVELGTLKKGDFVCIPKLGRYGLTSDTHINLDPYIDPALNAIGYQMGRSRSIKSIPLNEDTAWFIGLYCAEGSSSPSVNFSLGYTEQVIAERIKYIAENIGYHASIHKTNKDRTLVVKLGTVVLGRWLKEHCGKDSYTKHIPHCILYHKDIKIRQAFLAGLMDGDGCYFKKGKYNYMSIGTVSKFMATDLALLLAQNNTCGNIRLNTRGPRYIGERLINKIEYIYSIEFNLDGIATTTRKLNGKDIISYSHSWKIDSDGIWVPIKAIENIPYIGKVYNLETKDHTYVASSFLVHNCMDAEINDDLEEEHLLLPKDMITPATIGKPNGKVWEEYYRELYDEADKYVICTDPNCTKESDNSKGQGQGSGKVKHIHLKSCGSGAHNHIDDYEEDDTIGDKLTPAEAEAIRRTVAKEINDYVKKSRGHVPAGLRRWAEDYLEPKVPWNRELRVSLRKSLADVAGMVDTTYRRISRRQSIYKDMVMPGFRKPIPKVGIIIDTSGSVSEKGLARALTETTAILKASGYIKDVMVLSCDAEVHQAKKVVNPKQIQLYGGGGTDMNKGFEFIKTSRFKPDIVVLITDAETPWPSEPTPYRTICLAVGKLSQASINSIPKWMKTLVVDD